MSYIIGIDLGTSTTEAAVYQDGKPVMLFNTDGKVVTPSVIGLDENDQFIIGERARAQFLLYPEKTAIEVKRKIGSNETIALGADRYTPVQLSAKLLEYVRKYASDALHEDITRAVISVPAYFDDLQRRETIAAGQKAGFTVERILNEPTAAAMSYGLAHIDDESHILVYDLGGGTFDVTLLEMFDGILEVKASSGDNELGGKDFDQCLIDYLVRKFKSENGIDLKKNLGAMVQLKDAAEACKIALSTSEEYRVTIPFIASVNNQPLGIDEIITRTDFERLTRNLIERTHAPINTVLSDANIPAASIDHVLLVGGSTRMPAVVKDIEAFLGLKPSVAVNPDYAVAEGAAIQAAIINGDIFEEHSLVMTDVNPYTLGIRSVTGYDMNAMTVLIHRNATIPTSHTERFYTIFDNQPRALIEVYQGESSSVLDNHKLSDFVIDGIPPAPACKEYVDVTFSYTLNGILAVTAVISTGKQAHIDINMLDGIEDTAAAVPQVENEGDTMDKDAWKKAELADNFRTVIRQAEKLLKSGSLTDVQTTVLTNSLNSLKKSIIQNNVKEASSQENNLLELIEFMK